MLSQMDTGWAFASFLRQRTDSQSVPPADRDGGAGSVVDIQVNGGKQLLPCTDLLPAKPKPSCFQSPCFPALLSAGTDCASLPHPWKCSVPGWMWF